MNKTHYKLEVASFAGELLAIRKLINIQLVLNNVQHKLPRAALIIEGCKQLRGNLRRTCFGNQYVLITFCSGNPKKISSFHHVLSVHSGSLLLVPLITLMLGAKMGYDMLVSILKNHVAILTQKLNIPKKYTPLPNFAVWKRDFYNTYVMRSAAKITVFTPFLYIFYFCFFLKTCNFSLHVFKKKQIYQFLAQFVHVYLNCK